MSISVELTNFCRAWTLVLGLSLVLLSACSSDDPVGPADVDPISVLTSFEVIDSKTAVETRQFLEARDIPAGPNGYTLYRIVYSTVDTDGSSVKASGVVSIPDGNGNDWPILSYQHGTITNRNSVISVEGVASGQEGLLAVGGPSLGFVTAVPDYLGLGVSESFHPYVHAQTLGRSVVDMLRATRELCEAEDVMLNDKLFLAGYSEGGYATMAAHKLIEEEFADEFSITASAPMAGPYDMSGAMYDIMISALPYASPSYLPYVILTFNNIRNHYSSLAEIFAPPYDQTLPALFDGSKSGHEIDAQLPSVPLEMLNQAELQDIKARPDHPLRVYLRENDLYDWAPKARMRLYHCPLDEIVPFANSTKALDSFHANGAGAVELIEIDGSSHESCAIPAVLQAAFWFSTL